MLGLNLKAAHVTLLWEVFFQYVKTLRSKNKTLKPNRLFKSITSIVINFRNIYHKHYMSKEVAASLVSVNLSVREKQIHGFYSTLFFYYYCSY